MRTFILLLITSMLLSGCGVADSGATAAYPAPDAARVTAVADGYPPPATNVPLPTEEQERVRETLPETVAISLSAPHFGLFCAPDGTVILVSPNSPAAQAGVLVGDIALMMGDVPVKDNAVALIERIFQQSAINDSRGKVVPFIFTINRAGQEQTLSMLPEMPDAWDVTDSALLTEVPFFMPEDATSL